MSTIYNYSGMSKLQFILLIVLIVIACILLSRCTKLQNQQQKIIKHQEAYIAYMEQAKK